MVLRKMADVYPVKTNCPCCSAHSDTSVMSAYLKTCAVVVERGCLHVANGPKGIFARTTFIILAGSGDTIP